MDSLIALTAVMKKDAGGCLKNLADFTSNISGFFLYLKDTTSF